MAKYGYRDITDVDFIDIATNEIVIHLDYLKTSSQAFGQERVYQVGGRGAAKLVGFASGNSMKMDLESALITPQLLSIIFGNSITTGSQNVQKSQVVVATTNSFVLASTPVVGSTTPMTIALTTDNSTPDTVLTYTAGTPTATQFSVSGGTVTLHSTYSSGGTFLVNYYYATTASNKRLKFQSDKFSKAYRITGNTLYKNTEDELFYECKITIPKLQIEIDGATLNSAISGDPTSLKLSGQALKPYDSTDLVIYDIDEGVGISL